MSFPDDLPPRCRRCGGAQARLRSRAAAPGGGIRTVAPGRTARCVPGTLAQAPRQRRRQPRPASPLGRGGGSRYLGHGDLVSAHRERSHPAPVPRARHRRARIPRGAPPGVDRHHRAPRAAAIPQPAGDAARPGVCARSHVYVYVQHLRLDPAAGSHDSALGLDPSVLVLLVVFALPPAITAGWRPGVELAVLEAGAPETRLASHLFATATTAAPGKEVRVTGIGERLIARRRAAWERWFAPVSLARWGVPGGTRGLGDFWCWIHGRRGVCRTRNPCVAG